MIFLKLCFKREDEALIFDDFQYYHQLHIVISYMNQQFFGFNILYVCFLTNVSRYISGGLVLLQILRRWRRGRRGEIAQLPFLHPQKKTFSESLVKIKARLTLTCSIILLIILLTNFTVISRQKIGQHKDCAIFL